MVPTRTTHSGRPVQATLLQHGEQRIARQAQTAWLAVVAGNARARRFYERQGWNNAGPFDNVADIDGGTIAVPCLRYQKRLNEIETANHEHRRTTP